MTNRLYRDYIKRFLDIVLSAGAIVVLSPVMAVTAVLVRVKLGSPVLFKQKRPGKDERIFEMYKFRSMTDARDENGELLPDEVRLTSFGKKLRASSLDELPELFNILKGDMSVVGPRPLSEVYLPFYTEKEHHRHDVRPGLTGLAQVNGRNNLSWEEKFAYDLQYINKISFSGDATILLKTVGKVLDHEGDRAGRGSPCKPAYRTKHSKGENKLNIYGNKVLLRAMESEDMETLRNMANDPEIEKMVGGWSFPISRQEQLNWYEHAVGDKNNLRFIIEMINSGESVGMVNLVNIDWKNRSAFHGIKLKADAPKGQGIGTDAVMALMRYAFEELQLVRLDGSWVEYNAPSIALYKKCGWSVEGKKERAKFTEGSYYSVLFGGILAEKYFKIKEQLQWIPYDKK